MWWDMSIDNFMDDDVPTITVIVDFFRRKC